MMEWWQILIVITVLTLLSPILIPMIAVVVMLIGAGLFVMKELICEMLDSRGHV